MCIVLDLQKHHPVQIILKFAFLSHDSSEGKGGIVICPEEEENWVQ